jgi:hypothetical protein
MGGNGKGKLWGLQISGRNNIQVGDRCCFISAKIPKSYFYFGEEAFLKNSYANKQKKPEEKTSSGLKKK